MSPSHLNLDGKSRCKQFALNLLVSYRYYKRLWGTLNIQTPAQFYKTCIKPHIDYRAKQIITNCRCVNIEKSDFKQFCLAKFSDLVVSSVVPQYFTNVHSQDFNVNISLVSQINKSMSMCASFANKSYITFSKKSCDNCFLYTAPKLWNSLPNNITSQCKVNSFNTYLFKYVFTAIVLSLFLRMLGLCY